MTARFATTEQRLALEGISLNYAAGPRTGRPMVMLHGITNWWRSFESVMPKLGSRWSVYALDLRGHGQSSHVPGGYRWRAASEDVVEFLRAQLAEPAVLVGHSMGASVAIAVATHAPEAVQALVLEEPVLYAHRGERQRGLLFFPFLQGYERIARAGGTAEEMLPALAELHNEPNQELLRGKANSLSVMDPNALAMRFDGTATDDFDTDHLLRRVACPTLLLVGKPALGSANSGDDVARASALLRNATVVPVAGLGHWILRERPQEYCDLVVRYLDSL
jgi:pimeloyl-ACP methyl ester carboxylesterase